MGKSVAADIANKARQMAMKQLRAAHEVEYVFFYEAEAARLREELGYKDGRLNPKRKPKE